MANASLHSNSLPYHPMEHTLQLLPLPSSLSFTPNATPPMGQLSLPPLAAVDIYLDDFMAVAQPPRHTPTMRGLLHSIDAIFYDTPASSPRLGIISKSKIDKGDAAWSLRKTILGWDIDTTQMTLQLPLHWQQRLAELLSTISHRKRALAIAGAKYHFSIFQNALTHRHQRRITITSLLCHALRDWTELLIQLSHPMPLHAVVPWPPAIIAGCDASIMGVGGWLWDPAHPTTVYLWQYPFSPHITRHLISTENPSRSINNRKLELAGIILTAHLASVLSPHKHPMIWCASDNQAAVAWSNNGSTSTTSPSAFLLHLLGQLSQWNTFTLQSSYVSGSSNMLADSPLPSF
jgi:hypothetical protein